MSLFDDLDVPDGGDDPASYVPEARARRARRPAESASSTSEPRRAVPLGTRATSGRTTSGRSIASVRSMYFLLITVTMLGLAVVVPTGEAITLAAVVGAWLVLSLVTAPSIAVSGQGLVSGLTVMLLMRNYGDLDASGRVWGYLCMALVTIPFIVKPLRKVDGFPFFHLYFLAEGIYVYVSVLFARPGKFYTSTYPPEVRSAGFRVLSVYLAVFLVGGWLMSGLLRRAFAHRRSRPKPEPRSTASQRASVWHAYVVMLSATALVLVLHRTGLEGSLGLGMQLVKSVAFGGWLVLCLASMRRNLPLRHLPVLFAVPAVWAIATVGDTRLYQVAAPGFLLLALWMGEKRRIPWLAVIAALIGLIVVNVGKGDLRIAEQENLDDESSAQVGVNWLQHANEGLGDETDARLEASASRFSNSDLLGYLDTWVPDRYPWYGYEPYTSLPTIIVPRVFMPDKPTFGFANEFGRRYELIARSDNITSVNTPLPVEAYVTGGYVPLVVAGALAGMYYIALQRLFRSSRNAVLLTATLLSLQVVFTTEAGVLAILPILPYAIVLYPIMRWATRGVPERAASTIDATA